jgi:hypothetical protein
LDLNDENRKKYGCTLDLYLGMCAGKFMQAFKGLEYHRTFGLTFEKKNEQNIHFPMILVST